MAAPNPEPAPVTMIFLFSRRIYLLLPGRSRTTDGSAVFDDNGFGDTELAHGLEALFAAMTGPLDATKRQFDAAAGTVTVDEDLAALHGASDPHHAAAITAPHTGNQAELGAVGDADRVRLVLERDHRENRSEHFMAGQHVCGLHRSEQNRRHIVAVRRDPGGQCGLGEHRHAIGLCLLDEVEDAITLTGADQWAAIEVHLGR